MSDTLFFDRPDATGASAARASDAASGRLFLERLLDCGVILHEDWEAANESLRDLMFGESTRAQVIAELTSAKLLTAYQAARLDAGPPDQLVLGNYRILDRIGAGGMGVVYRAEHRLLRRVVAIKVLQGAAADSDILLQRFFVETRSLSQLRHRHIVWAFDAGVVDSPVAGTGRINYLVMEYVNGANLEQAAADAPIGVTQACEWMFQIASALDATHKLNLIHRDIKPSNILVGADGVAKLLDFGLAVAGGRNRLTTPGTLLGTLSYMAPEQVGDAASVDIRADIYGLGSTFFYCLTGKPPFPTQGSLTHLIAARLTQSRPEIRALRPDVPSALEAVIQRMMAHYPDERYATPQSVMRALLPYINASRGFGAASTKPASVHDDATSAATGHASQPARVLIIDDEPLLRNLCKTFFRREGFATAEAGDGIDGLALAEKEPFDLVLLDIDMPRMCGTETLRRLRLNPQCASTRIIMISGGISSDDMAEVLDLGADDYLTKPLNRHQLIARAKAALLHKAAQDQAEQLHEKLLCLNADMEQTLNARSSDLVLARNALIFALARIVQSRTNETKEHLLRLQAYVRILGAEARKLPRFARQINEAFLQTLEACAILHDIGNVALPDDILRAGACSAEERLIAQSHTTIGAETLGAVAKRDTSAVAFWEMAIDVARHHHERFDGRGFPDGLRDNDIPLAARVVAIADAYDSLRAPDARGTPLSHGATVDVLVQSSPGQFDPLLLQAFEKCETEFDRVFRAHCQATQ
jgi:response regulator RpfG family c-di-GMP phosphodiesterase